MKESLRRRFAAAQDQLVSVAVFRTLFLAWSVLKALWYRTTRNDFEAADATLRYSRILSGATRDAPASALIARRNAAVVRRCVETGPPNYLWKSYHASPEAERYRQEFGSYGLEHARALKYPRTDGRTDREGDLLVLKPWLGADERGAVLVQYNDGIRKFAALYDVRRLAERYRIVLEPSTWGYEEATFLMLLGLDTDVVVQAQFHRDYDYIRSLGHNMHPIDLGAGDWVDPETFRYDPQAEKQYDVIMVASWLSLKRHALLFSALRSIGHRPMRVALVGYPSGGRTVDDVKREAAGQGVLNLLDIYERIPPEQVNQLLQQSRVSVMLTKREGASRAIYESFFSNVPVLVSKDNVGVNRAHVNDRTGMFSTDDDLGPTLVRLIRESARYAPRAWALEHTGYRNSTRRLNAILKDLARQRGEAWSADLYLKQNRPHAMYADGREREIARRQFAGLDPFLTLAGHG